MDPDELDQKAPPRFTGAYEEWAYGDGLAYADLSIPWGEIRYISAVAILPPGAALSDLGGLRAPVRVNPRLSLQVLAQLYWSGSSQEKNEPSHWPIILDFGDPKNRQPLDIDVINEALLVIASPAREIWRGKGIEGDLSVTLNAPLTVASATVPAIPPLTAPFTPDPALKARLAANPNGPKIAVVAVIDDGLPFAHRGLWDKAGTTTRMQFCWLQSDAKEALLPGRELTRNAINTLVENHGPDEDTIYRRAGAIETTADYSATIMHFASHGAHVLDAACGQRPGQDTDLDQVLVIGVQLAAPVTIDTTSYRKDGPILAAMNYIFDRADKIADAYLGSSSASLPLVINFSYGFTGGPHDGTDRLELAMEQMVRARRLGKGSRPPMPTELIIPSGNSFAESMNGEIPADALKVNQPCSISWRLQPNNSGTNFLELWVPNKLTGSSAPQLSVKVIAPDGTICKATKPLSFTVGGTGAFPMVAAKLTCSGKAVGSGFVSRYNARWLRTVLAIQPSEPRKASLPAAPAGVWSIELTQTAGSAIAGPVHCRIQRDNDPFGYRRGGRQSRFEDPLDERFTPDGAPSRIENPPSAFVKRFGTVNGLATHREVTVVSSFYEDTGRATAYASAGARIPTGYGDVKLSVPADAATCLPGRLSAGTRSGSIVRMFGTSMAAPLVTRRRALELTGTEVPLALGKTKTEVSQDERALASVRLGNAIIA